jgi:hypothetical protein
MIFITLQCESFRKAFLTMRDAGLCYREFKVQRTARTVASFQIPIDSALTEPRLSSHPRPTGEGDYGTTPLYIVPIRSLSLPLVMMNVSRQSNNNNKNNNNKV